MNFKVSFFKIERKMDEETGKPERNGEEEYLGHVIIDDSGCGRDLTLEAKAFRRASPNCLFADKTISERLS